MIALSDWSDLVTTALLGTNRRQVPTGLPTDWARTSDALDSAIEVLELAARHRAWSRAGSRLASADPPVAGPSGGELAPASAQELLSRMLDRPRPATVNAWLAGCVGRGWLVAPGHWTPLAELAARTVAYDRTLLALALGPRGQWFVKQNPDWGRLAAQLEAAVAESDLSKPAEPGPSMASAAERSAVDTQHLVDLFGHAGPFAAELEAIFS